MSFLKFFGDEVKGIARTLETSGEHMRGASKEMQRVDASRLGHADLHSACDDFADSWHYGFGQLSKATKGISEYADKASDEFQKMDQKLADDLRKKSQEHGGS
ncbi:hypothetical protein ACIQCJ_04260 [Streptomyces sp. NPDC093221]|uniref:hypothetical protein n=1 Tax=Streptomyces sp. NPDC093221 TaxID=3366032 RepID=UPI0038055E4C